MNAPTKDEAVPFEAGKKRGKVFVPKYNEAELAAIGRKNAIAESVRLDDDEEAALGGATVDDLMSLAEILDSNPQVSPCLIALDNKARFVQSALYHGSCID